MMIYLPSLRAIGIGLLLGCSAPGATDDQPAADQRAEAARRHGLEFAVPPESRVKPTSPSVLKLFEELGGPAPTPHPLTAAERSRVSAAFAALPPLHRQVLADRLRSINFLDGMPNTALTSTINPGEPYLVFDITIRAGILDQTVSDWLTWRERGYFEPGNSPLSVTVEAGTLDALVYVLLHEATHVVDSCLRITPSIEPGPAAPATDFTAGVWSDRLTPAPPYRDALLEHLPFRSGGRRTPIDQAEATYRALGRTPFVSLYGSSSWYDDLAESVAVAHLTATLGQPYRIVIRDGAAEVFRSEPVKSPLVRERLGQIKRFSEGDGRPA